MGNTKTIWCGFFSLTGTDIINISKKLGRYPDYIITNRESLAGANKEFIQSSDLLERLIFLPKKPTVEEYNTLFSFIRDSHPGAELLITLHGYMRIIPKEFCEMEIYNLHPGLVSKYNGILKGKDPQEKAVELKLPTTGCTLHRVTSEVDSGEIIDEEECSIAGLSVEQVTAKLKQMSVDMWIKFFKNKIDF